MSSDQITSFHFVTNSRETFDLITYLCRMRRLAMKGSVARMALAGARREMRASLKIKLKFVNS